MKSETRIIVDETELYDIAYDVWDALNCKSKADPCVVVRIETDQDGLVKIASSYVASQSSWPVRAGCDIVLIPNSLLTQKDWGVSQYGCPVEYAHSRVGAEWREAIEGMLREALDALK